MKPVDYVAIAIRFLAIALFIYGLKALGGSLQLFYEEYSVPTASWVVSLIHTVTPIMLGFILWFFPNLIARKIIGDENSEPAALSAYSLLSTLVAALGVFTFFYAFADAWYWAFFASMASDAPYGYETPFKPDIIGGMWATGIELALSLILIFKCRTIANFIIKVSR